MNEQTVNIREIRQTKWNSPKKILKQAPSETADLRRELSDLYRQAFPLMPASEQTLFVDDFFTCPARNMRHTALFRKQGGSLFAAVAVDTGNVLYSGQALAGLYLLSRAVSPEWQGKGAGKAIALKVINDFAPDVLLTTCGQSAALHSWIRLTRKALGGAYEIFPRMEKERLLPLPDDETGPVLTVFRQLFSDIIGKKPDEMIQVLSGLSVLMVRKGMYEKRYNFSPWNKNNRQDRLAQALGLENGDGVLVALIKKRHRILMNVENAVETACRKFPVIRKALREYGDHSIGAYIKTLGHENKPCPPPDPDLAEAVYQTALPVMDKSAARQASEAFGTAPVALTANHLGVEYFAQSLQSSLMFALGKQLDSPVFAPVFSFGNIPMNNLTYPRGMLIYNTKPPSDMPLKLPVHPGRFNRQMAGCTRGFDREMVARALKQVRRLAGDDRIPAATAQALHLVLTEDYSAKPVQAAGDYSTQSALVNRRVWKRLFAPDVPVPELVYLEIEKIVIRLLQKDLFKPSGLTALLFFDEKLRQAVMEELDGVQGCWHLNRLQDRCSSLSSYPRLSTGTVFFWALTPEGNRIPLYVDKNNQLRGSDDNGRQWTMPFRPKTVWEALAGGRIIPSLFTCFLSLAFEHKVICVGGYFQCAYLPAIKKGLMTALEGRGCHELAGSISGLAVQRYLSGMLAVMTRCKKIDALVPAGPLEIIAGGGLNGDNINKILSLSIKDAHIAGMFETLPDVIPNSDRPPGWKTRLAVQCADRLSGSIAEV